MTNQAAERLRRLKRHGGSDSVFVTHGNGEAVSLNDVRADYENVVDAYLSENLPDDGEAIDEAWLAATGWAKGGLCMWLGEYLTWSSRRGVFVGMYPQSHIRTRGQLRLLLRALGVEGEGE